MASSKTEAHFFSGKKTIVAGAGMAGLAFVASLRKQWNPGLPPPEIVIHNCDNGEFKPAKGLPTSGIRIARKDLRQPLVDAVSASTEISWGTSCISATRLDAECDLLITADGESSKMRAYFRLNNGLQYAGAIQMGGIARFDGPLPPPVSSQWGGIVTGTGVFCFYSLVEQTSIVWALGIREQSPRPPFDNNDSKQVQAMLDEAKNLGSNTAPSETLRINGMDKQPFYHNGNLLPVVFLGDSNHAVSPSAGYGATQALKDGWELAKKVVQSTSLTAAVKAYDTGSVPQALATIKNSQMRIDVGHSTGLKYWAYRGFFALGGSVLQLMGGKSLLVLSNSLVGLRLLDSCYGSFIHYSLFGTVFDHDLGLGNRKYSYSLSSGACPTSPSL
ncbi:hypothetical protein BJ170DRAFT_702241 [Xylariales sp. AK1849]|nr:hypothetical protein BJ170DRAFT_702241 [Xylariales sp. AK1849]